MKRNEEEDCIENDSDDNSDPVALVDIDMETFEIMEKVPLLKNNDKVKEEKNEEDEDIGFGDLYDFGDASSKIKKEENEEDEEDYISFDLFDGGDAGFSKTKNEENEEDEEDDISFDLFGGGDEGFSTIKKHESQQDMDIVSTWKHFKHSCRTFSYFGASRNSKFCELLSKATCLQSLDDFNKHIESAKNGYNDIFKIFELLDKFGVNSLGKSYRSKFLKQYTTKIKTCHLPYNTII